MATKGKEVAVVTAGAFPVLSGENGELLEALKENIEGDQFNEFDIPRIKVPTAGQTAWQIPTLDGFDSKDVIEGIIVKWFNRRAYWAGRFKGGNEPPQCSSQDAIIGVGDPGGECAKCPFAQFGSSQNEESPNAQACKHVKLFFILTPGSMLPTVLAVPPTSLKNSRQYMFQLSNAGIPHSGVITKFVLESDRSNTGIEYSKVSMLAGERLSSDERAKVKEYTATFMPAFERVTITRDDVEAEADF